MGGRKIVPSNYVLFKEKQKAVDVFVNSKRENSVKIVREFLVEMTMLTAKQRNHNW